MMNKIFFLLVILQSYMISQDKNTGIIILSDGWMIQSSEKVKTGGDIVSAAGFNTEGWYKTDVPSTVLASLVKNNIYSNIFFGDNLKHIPQNQFAGSWWYRKEFSVPAEGSKTVRLKFDGINFYANIWLNGNLIAGKETVYGAYRQPEYDITGYINRNDKNILAVEVFPPLPSDFTVGFVDWNPTPPDKNMGIFRQVKLLLSGDVSIKDPYVKSELDCKNFKTAKLTVSAEVKNNGANVLKGTLEGKIEAVTFKKEVTLQPGESRIITFTPEEYTQLIVNDPRVWWTHDLGKQELYTLNLAFKINDEVSSSAQTRFGIREIKDYFNEDGHRGYIFNGKKILIKGGGWVDNMLLDNTYENLQVQVDYAARMNLNTIRLEGFWGNNEDLYNLCDEKGILLMAGWNCQWEQKAYIDRVETDYGVITNDADKKLLADSWRDQIVWLRNHPSIFVWLYGSDKVTEPVLEQAYLDILSEYDPSRPHLSTAGNQVSSITGSAGVKMRGPYDYVPPHYWYTDTAYGGAFGFNTETGPGPQVPVISSIKKFIPAEHLWPVDSMWNYHCGGLTFKDLGNYSEALNKRLGEPASLEEYCIKAQFINYEAMRAMFEAFTFNKHNATGIIQWMYNAAWPKFWWQFFDYYLIPNSSFYAARKANEPVHIMYNYGTETAAVVNNTFNSFEGLEAKVSVYDLEMKKLFSFEKKFNLPPDSSVNIVPLTGIEGLTSSYFVDLKLSDNSGKEVSSNFYTLSTTGDVLDYNKHQWYITPLKEFADYTSLNKLSEAEIKASAEIKDGKITVVVENLSSALAYQLELRLEDNKGEIVVPVTWDDNYFSLLPGESKKISCGLDNIYQSIKLSGWNVKETEVK
jgi:exo-1,4-beta-D-glucosaminidase